MPNRQLTYTVVGRIYMEWHFFHLNHTVACDSFEGTCDLRNRWTWPYVHRKDLSGESDCIKPLRAQYYFWAQTHLIKPAQRKQADPGSGFLNPIKGVCPVLNHRGVVDTQ